MDDTEFSQIAQEVLSRIVDTIEAVDIEGLIDIDSNSDIITLTTDLGVFIINKHSAAKEIWLASPISGPYRFSYNSGGWRTKYNVDIFDILAKELNIKFNKNHK